MACGMMKARHDPVADYERASMSPSGYAGPVACGGHHVENRHGVSRNSV
jgi:hypothetical protein